MDSPIVELQACTQLHGETARQFGHRIQVKLSECEKLLEKSFRGDHQPILEVYQDIAIGRFQNGLISQSLREVACALDGQPLSRIIKIVAGLETPENQPVNYMSLSQSNWPQIEEVCEFCRRYGHITQECEFKRQVCEFDTKVALGTQNMETKYSNIGSLNERSVFDSLKARHINRSFPVSARSRMHEEATEKIQTEETGINSVRAPSVKTCQGLIRVGESILEEVQDDTSQVSLLALNPIKGGERATISREIPTPREMRVSVLPEIEVQVHSKRNTVKYNWEYLENRVKDKELTKKDEIRAKDLTGCRDNASQKREKEEWATKTKEINYHNKIDEAGRNKHNDTFDRKSPEGKNTLTKHKINDTDIEEKNKSNDEDKQNDESKQTDNHKQSVFIEEVKSYENSIEELNRSRSIKNGSDNFEEGIIQRKLECEAESRKDISNTTSLNRKPEKVRHCEGKTLRLYNSARDGKFCFTALIDGLYEDLPGHLAKLKNQILEIKSPIIPSKELIEEIPLKTWKGHTPINSCTLLTFIRLGIG